MKPIFLYLLLSISLTFSSAAFHDDDTEYSNLQQKYIFIGNNFQYPEHLLSIVNTLDYNNLNKGVILDKKVTITSSSGYELQKLLTYEISRQDNDSPMLIKLWMKNGSLTQLIRMEVFKSATQENKYGEFRLDSAELNVSYENASNIDFSNNMINVMSMEAKILETKNRLSFNSKNVENQNSSAKISMERHNNGELDAILKFKYGSGNITNIEKLHFSEPKVYIQTKNLIEDSNGTYEDQITNTIYNGTILTDKNVESVDIVLFDYETGDYLKASEHNRSTNFHCYFGTSGSKNPSFDYTPGDGNVYSAFSFDKNTFADEDDFYVIYYWTNEVECSFDLVQKNLYGIKQAFVTYSFPIINEVFDTSKLVEDDESFYPIISEDNIKSIGNKPQ